MKPLPLHPEGSRLAGKFRVVKLLGTGGMGAVYEVEHERLAKRYALKVLHTDEQRSSEWVQRFQREIKADGHIRNAHIVEVHDDGVLETGEPFVVMELLEGETLAHLIERKGRLDLAEICELIGQACDGVQAAHEAGIIHRDLKPENLFVTLREGKPFVKVLDFGIAKFQVAPPDNMKSTSRGAILGTPYYLSPEQIRGNVESDARVDVYALGVILYECATGRVPFRADTLPLLGVLICEGKPEPLGTIRPDLPESFRHCVLQAMAVERERRTRSARELGAVLRALGAHGASTTLSSPAALNSLSIDIESDPMRSTEIIEEPLDLPRPAPTHEREQRPAVVQQRRLPWAMMAIVAFFGVGAIGLWMGGTESANRAPSASAISSPTMLAPSVEMSNSPAVPLALSTENKAVPSAASSGTNRAKAPTKDRAKELGINPRLPP